MSCPKNPKKWWIFNYRGPHKDDNPYIRQFMRGEHIYKIHRTCEYCGQESKETAWSQSELHDIFPSIDMKKFNDAMDDTIGSIPGSCYLNEVREDNER